MEKELWLKFKELLHEVSEGKKTVDEALTIALQALDHLEKEENALSDNSGHHRNASTISQDGEINI